MQSLAQDPLAMDRQDTGLNDPKRECCIESVGSNYCSKYGDRLVDERIYGADFQSWLLELLERDLSSIAYLEEDVTERNVAWKLGYSASEMAMLSKSRKTAETTIEPPMLRLGEYVRELISIQMDWR